MKHVSIVGFFVFLSLIVVSVVLAQQGPKSDGKVEYYKNPKPMPLPFSEAVRVGNTLYLSGEIGVDNKTHKLVEGGIKAEAKQVMENIKATLERNGSSMDQVVKCTVMIVDMKEWSAFNEVYVTYFKKDRFPARSAFGSNGLAFGAKVEVECLATVDK